MNIEQLLLRERIILDTKNISGYISGRRILITGAAGSIGKELAKQIITFSPASICLIDQSESGIHDLQTAINSYTNINFKIASVTDQARMEKVFQDFGPEVIFHAAAYKHVPLLENQPEVAIKNNIIGTQIITDLAIIHRVEKFIFISTDKAVNPVSIMGMSERISELHLLQMNRIQPTTQFIITRFGNVLGTSGSVYLTFQKQILAGGPVTVTHPQASRYFMLVEEAVQLVLEAASIGKGGQIVIFDMGKPVLITDLAKRMIDLYSVDTDTAKVSIHFSKLRNGEKLHEQLLYNDERVHYSHGKLKVTQSVVVHKADITAQINFLRLASEKAASDSLIPMMKEICFKDMISEQPSLNSSEVPVTL